MLVEIARSLDHQKCARPHFILKVIGAIWNFIYHYKAEIEGSCNEVQPVPKTHAVQSIQRFYFQSLAIAQI